MSYQPHLPMIVQSDRSILVEVQNPLFEQARQAIVGFTELVKSPEYIHTYRITPLSLWNAAASGMSCDEVLSALADFSKFGVPPSLAKEIQNSFSRYGLVRLEKLDDHLTLVCDDPFLLTQLMSFKSINSYIDIQLTATHYKLKPYSRGLIKQELIKLGYPVKDIAGYTDGEPCDIGLSDTTVSGRDFGLRDYQQEAVETFYANGSVHGGSGVLCLPCGAGKTVIGIGAMAKIKSATLILTTNTTSVHQWINEVLDKTSVTPDMIGEYTGEAKEVRPITVATYQILTHRRQADGEFPHMKLFDERNWGFIIYDEVHMLPAPVFKMTANIQAKRRLGLTATLVREDGLEEDVFSLVGPKKYDMPWKQLEQQGYIAQATCKEIRLPIDPHLRESYAMASPRQKYRIAAENPRKHEVITRLIQRHADDQILIIGQYVDQLESLSDALGIPLITGRVHEKDRARLYQQFKSGELKQLIVSKVANFAIDLPDANVAIQISGTFGSRQEEAQRLGRILRPKARDNTAHFYTLVTRDTQEQEYASKRQLFLVEQGYRYEIEET
ncbi:DNA repair helicase XPB [Brevibacillus dissolubilis]|uniref:DNA repair helicase XPB n=1 Tax=Brevibacillus dissolubilis TaxID=1844116 RepID=UPI001117954B|nr:DNA repair helicase XPB [Brevibacillus dissolubilis]